MVITNDAATWRSKYVCNVFNSIGAYPKENARNRKYKISGHTARMLARSVNKKPGLTKINPGCD